MDFLGAALGISTCITTLKLKKKIRKFTVLGIKIIGPRPLGGAAPPPPPPPHLGSASAC